MHRFHFLLFASFILASLVSLGQTEIYHLIEVEDDTVFPILQSAGVDLEHYRINTDGHIEFVVSEAQRSMLEQQNVAFTIITTDLKQDYLKRLALDQPPKRSAIELNQVADHFGYGSMGGFYTLEEIELKLDSMEILFPDLVKAKFSIGTSVEGRTIWALKISDNPDIDEDEPTAYFDALHHAREPLSMAVTLNYMFWLLENYTVLDEVQFLIDHRELYFVPVVNPDGYEYNRQTDPNGGGLWRKNRKVNGACIGVDLNRNYGFEFGHNNNCSSDNPCSNIYRGESAFSEPETQAVRDFIASIEPKTAFSTHSTAGSYLMPYGYNTSPPAFGIYSEWASNFLSINDYPYGVTFQMLGYTSCGTTRDYFHSENIYGWTPEIDGSGFWPLPSEIFDLVDENVLPLFYQSWIAGSYAQFKSHSLNGQIVDGEEAELIVEVKNVGLSRMAENVEVIMQSLDSRISVSTTSVLGDIPARSVANTGSAPQIMFANEPITEAFEFQIEVIVRQDGVITDQDTIWCRTGAVTMLFEDKAESGSSNWLASGNGIAWDVNADDSYSGSFSFGDSNNGNAENDTENQFTLNQTIDLSDLNEMDSPFLQFASKWSIESSDQTELQYSTNLGASWNTIHTYTLNHHWNREHYDLSFLKSQSAVQFRWTHSTDGFLPGDGFYFDDFQIINYRCCDFPTTIEEINTTRIQIVPVPARNNIKLIWTNAQTTEMFTLDIYDNCGALIKQMHVSPSTPQIDISDLPSGVFFIHLHHNTTSLTTRLIKL